MVSIHLSLPVLLYFGNLFAESGIFEITVGMELRANIPKELLFSDFAYS